MDLPRIKRRLPVYETETVSMGTYNRSDNIKPGDILDSYGLSARRWPNLATRRAWKQEQKPGDTTSIFAWDGHKVRVTGGLLYYDDKPIENVAPGDKQFAVVNTKLIVWPDKVFIDVTNGTFGDLGTSTTLKTATFSPNSITGNLTQVVARDVLPTTYTGGGGAREPDTYTYGSDPGAIKWTGAEWELPPPTTTSFYYDVRRQIQVGDILIPSKTGNAFGYVISENIGVDGLDTSKYNQEGYYAKVTKVDIGGSGPSIYSKVYSDIYKLGTPDVVMSTLFNVGDAVNIRGTFGGYLDRDKAIIKGINDNLGQLTFADDTWQIPDAYAEMPQDTGPGIYTLSAGDITLYFSSTKKILKGWFLIASKNTIAVWDPAAKAVQATYPGTPGSNGISITGVAYDKSADVTITRPVPDMDFICEKDNRLWGCSNETRTIYASSLGLPDRFWDYEGGLATNSYAVTVGSEGDFTGCAPYRNSVVFFKEDKIHRVVGDFPAQYRLYKDIAEGVAAGSHKSIQHIAGLMYYLGTHGVYSYNGGAPVLISYNFGDTHFSGGISGNDGDTYYLSAVEGGTPHLLMYDTKRGIWVHDGNTRARDFARIDRTVYMCQEDGSVQNIATEEDDPWLEWMCQLCPYWDTLEGHKVSESLSVRMELPAGSWLRVLVRYDGGRWQEATRVVGSEKNSVFVPLPVARADKTEIKLEGKGPCAILSMLRRFRVGSPRK